ncbi:MAG: dihydroorotase, partial [Ignavibacteriaceae bacterium]|nr:dihydroorotase [Ignavibacteriaceae bacterium]
MKTLLKNLTIIDHNLKEYTGHIVIENGKIIETGKVDENSLKNDTELKIYDLEGCYASPGFIDMHVHLREPGREDKETVLSGCNAAANGGFTAVACMPNTDPTIDSAEIVESIIHKSKNHLVDVYPIAAATIERKGEFLSPIAELVEAGAVAFSDDGVAIKTAAVLRRVMEYASMFNVPVIEHCEDESMAGGSMNEGYFSTIYGVSTLPPVAEDITVSRDILMSEFTGAKLHIAHISTKRSIELVREAKTRGVRVTAEVTPHHFTLTDEALKNYDTNLKMNPPLRTATDVEEVLKGLSDGTIDVIATDHAPHTIEEKEMEFEYAPNGILGLETCIGLSINNLVHKGILTLSQLVEKLAINPRKVLNLEIPKIEPG